MIRFGILIGASMLSVLLGGIGVAVWLILLFALEWLYPAAFELSRSGATPGKRALGLQVVMDNGLPVTPAAALTRNLLRAADFLPFGYGFALVCMLLRRDCKRLGDLAAATIVVHAAREQPPVPAGGVVPIAPVRPLDLEGRAALVALAARAPRLSSGRLDELAALAAAVSGDAGRRGPAVTTRVLGVAHWLLGHRA